MELPRNYFIESGPTPWSNFESLVLGQRFLNARLSPVPERISRPKVTWSDSQIKIVNDLMSEATALMDMFDQVAMLLGPDIKLHKISGILKINKLLRSPSVKKTFPNFYLFRCRRI